jgi:glycogen operon protein
MDYSHSLAFELHAPEDNEHLYIALNAYWKPLTFELPPLPGDRGWYRIVDTYIPTPDDFIGPAKALAVQDATYTVRERTSVILIAR